jgi:hypothetical protein
MVVKYSVFADGGLEYRDTALLIDFGLSSQVTRHT